MKNVERNVNKTGEFNLDFPGATIICDSERKRSSILQFLQGKQDSIDIKIDYSNEEQTLYDAIYNTTYIHEGKHLYDHLVCPALVHNWLLKITSFYYSSLASIQWNSRATKYKVLPIPFVRWIELPLEKKRDLIGAKGLEEKYVPMFTLHQAASLLDGSFQCDDAFMSNILLGALHYSEFLYNNNNIDNDSYATEYSIRTFSESMAFVHQMTSIVSKYGNNGQLMVESIVQDSFNSFMELGRRKRECLENITAKDYIGYSTYTAMFTYVWRYVVQNNINPTYRYPLISYMLFWAMSGNVFLDNKKASSPRNRLERLLNIDRFGINLNLNHEDSLSELFTNPIETFNKWDEYIAEAYLGTNVIIFDATGGSYHISETSTPINFVDFYNRVLQSEFYMVQQLDNIGHSSLAKYIDSISHSSYKTIVKYLQDPESYLYPEKYLNKIYELPNVPYRIKFENVNTITSDECGCSHDNILFRKNYIYGNGLLLNANNKETIIDGSSYLAAEPYINFANAIYGASYDSDIIEDFLPNVKLWYY